MIQEPTVPINQKINGDALLQALAPFSEAVPPPGLFRFFPPVAAGCLQDGMLKISPPCEFNDPFELSPGIDFTEITQEKLRQNFHSPTGLTRRVFAPRFSDENAYATWIESTVIARRDLEAQHLQTLRDSVAWAASRLFGIGCFSAFCDEDITGPVGIRHWSSYSSDHKGFAIEFDGTHPLLKTWAKDKWLFPVRYFPERPIVSITEFDDWTELKPLVVLRRWAEMKCRQAWGEEREWRLICPLASVGKIRFSKLTRADRDHYFLHLWGKDGPDENTGRLIKRVILGKHLSGEPEESIRAALKQPHLSHVILQRAELCPRHYALVLRNA